ncbi:hypothetical protein [Labilibaculum sp.]|uniref:hypothetical protein n=1 Tax=Labilibaculum sp. TaxID=2060723 RepID=UPI0035655B77
MLSIFLLLACPVFALSPAGELETVSSNEMASLSLSHPKTMGSSASQDKYSMWERTVPSAHYYSLGITPGSKMSSGFGLQGSYDLKLSPVVSLGVQINVFWEESDFSKDKTGYFGPRLNIDLLELMSSGSRAWDVYVGFTAGAKTDADDAKLDGEAYFGVRWNYAVRWSMYSEVGNGAVLGMVFKL